tara:strand:+ start:395 stop:619 length:225 start_codon:yes stop_codon:yes gene_type:complete
MNRAEKLMLVIEGLVKSLNNQVDKNAPAEIRRLLANEIKLFVNLYNEEYEKQKFCEEMFDWMKEQIYQKRVKPD